MDPGSPLRCAETSARPGRTAGMTVGRKRSFGCGFLRSLPSIRLRSLRTGRMAGLAAVTVLITDDIVLAEIIP